MHSAELVQFLSVSGDSKWLIPAATMLAAVLASQRHVRFAVFWLAALATAAFIVLFSKVAFLGFGIGIHEIDFTGFSGHAAMSAAIFPVAGYLLGNKTTPRVRLFLFALGAALAISIAMSRVWINAHSVSESVLGSALGLSASLITLALARAQLGIRSSLVAVAFIVPAFLMTNALPNHNTHLLVTKIALSLSGRSQPYDRKLWLRQSASTTRVQLNPQRHCDDHAIGRFQPPATAIQPQTV